MSWESGVSQEGRSGPQWGGALRGEQGGGQKGTFGFGQQ